MTLLLTIPGSDDRLESEIEVGRDDGLQFRAPSDGRRVALYGPYIDLPPGHYRFELEFRIQHRAEGQYSIELCDMAARRKHYVRPCFEWELESGHIRLSYPFERGVEQLEVRLVVPPEGAGSIRQLKVWQRATGEDRPAAS